MKESLSAFAIFENVKVKLWVLDLWGKQVVIGLKFLGGLDGGVSSIFVSCHFNFTMKNHFIYVIFLSGVLAIHSNCKAQKALTSQNNELKKADLYSFIIYKKEGIPRFPHNFNFAQRVTKKEIEGLGIDSTKIDLNEYYLLTDQLFVKKKIPGYGFKIYLKHAYGDQIEKIVRVTHNGVSKDRTLSMAGGAENSYSLVSEFLNNTTFKETSLYTQTIKDDHSGVGYQIDSVIRFYRYNADFDFIEFKKDSFTYYREEPYGVKINVDLLIGKINDYRLVYDCFDCRLGYSGGISVYAIKSKARRLLFSVAVADYYVSEVSLLKINRENFIYINTEHTYGHSQGYLYFLNAKAMRAYKVEIKEKKSHSRLPDSIYYKKAFILTKDTANRFGYGALLGTKDGSRNGRLSGTYALKKTKEGIYILISKKPEWGLEVD